jgi:hypothetical protein
MWPAGCVWRLRSSSLTCTLLLSLMCGAAPSASETLVVGDSLAPFELADQHGEIRRVDKQTRAILFSRDMDGGKLLKAGLAERTKGDLGARHVAYVADISGMPRLVARLFAVPSMRKRPYSMMLDREGDVTSVLPDQPGRATLVHLSALRVVAIDYLEDAVGVTAAVEALPGLGTDSAPVQGEVQTD